jgi:amino acid transporter
VFCFLILIIYGLVKYIFLGDVASTVPPNDEIAIADGYFPHELTWFLLLSAFSNGCAALTGIEAISNGVQAFKKPEARNASTTLVWMAILLSTMFFGTSLLAYLYHIHPHANETVISQFGRSIFSGQLGWFYYVIQTMTAAILILAANTAFADFPRLGSLLANDRFLPRQFSNRGDKFVFTYGIIVLAAAAGVLVAIFDGDTSRLIPLYAVGVFLSFTLSQSGMVIHWIREGGKIEKASPPEADQTDDIHASLADPQLTASRKRMKRKGQNAVSDEVTHSGRWKTSLALNLIGAVITAAVLVVFVLTKFIHGAWLVVLIIPLLVVCFKGIHRHYVEVSEQLETDGREILTDFQNDVVVPISGLHQGVLLALSYARSIAPRNTTAVFVDIDGKSGTQMAERWSQWDLGVPLVVLDSPYRSLTGPLIKFIESKRRDRADHFVTVILPEFVPAKWWQQLLHNQSSLILKGKLLFKRGVVVTNIPYHLE